jgi:N-acetylneuraminic acid mutarotase
MPHAVLDAKIYVPGGITASGVRSTVVEIYDPATDGWTTGTPLPDPLHHFGFVAANGKLYIVGGYIGGGFSPVRSVFELSSQNNEWNRKADIPTRRGAHAVVELDGKIYAIGGADAAGRALNSNERYDPETDSWTTLAPMLTPREHLAAAVIDSLIYVVGGRSAQPQGLVNSNRLEVYTPTLDRWTTLRNMPTARGGLAAASLNDRLYVFGGEFPGVFPQNQEYDPTGNSWRSLAVLPTPRHGMGAAAVGDRIFVIGGGPVAGFGVSPVNEAFVPPSE